MTGLYDHIDPAENRKVLRRDRRAWHVGAAAYVYWRRKMTRMRPPWAPQADVVARVSREVWIAERLWRRGQRDAMWNFGPLPPGTPPVR